MDKYRKIKQYKTIENKLDIEQIIEDYTKYLFKISNQNNSTFKFGNRK